MATPHPPPRGDDGDPASPDHYFSPAPAGGHDEGTVALRLGDVTVDLTTDRGVFSRQRIDPGTKLLLTDGDRPDPDADGDLLDLGCGYGPVAVALAVRAPGATVWAIDVNERARDLCRANAERAGVGDRVRVVAGEEVPAEVRFAGIWSNPPIRIGKAALHRLLAEWLGRLRADGHAHLVVQRHLGADSLARWLASSGHPTERVVARGGYRVLRVGAGTSPT